MRFLFALFSILILLNTNGQEIISGGCYRNNAGQIFEFHADTFSYIGVTGHTLRSGKGIYSVLNDTLTCQYFPDTTGFYTIQANYDTSLETDSVLIRVTDINSQSLVGSEIVTVGPYRHILTDWEGEVKIVRTDFPVNVCFPGCKSITVTKNNIHLNNKLIIKINLAVCYPKITGVEKYHIIVNPDFVVINGINYNLQKYGCSKIMIIE